jgi:hypothetical protein
VNKDFDNTNRGSIWKNAKKEKDTHPDFTGSANIGGVEHWVNAWRQKPGASEKAPVLTFTFRPKDAPKQDATADDMDSDIPF